MEQEVTPPSQQTLPDTARDYITPDRTQQTAIIEPSPIIKKPATPPSTPDSPPKKRTMNSPPEPISEPPKNICDVFSKPFPLHDKCDLHQPSFENFEALIVKAQRLPRTDKTLNVDLPVFFLFHQDHENWYFIKGPTSKLYYEEYHTAIEKKTETSSMLHDIIWYNFFEQACKDPEGTDHKLHRLVPPNI